MTCADVLASLDAYLDGQLTPAEAAVVAEHLDSCSACSEERERLGEVVEVVRGIPQPPAPEGFRAEVIRRLPPARSGAGAAAHSGRLLRWLALPASLAAACLLVVLVIHGTNSQKVAPETLETLEVAAESPGAPQPEAVSESRRDLDDEGVAAYSDPAPGARIPPEVGDLGGDITYVVHDARPDATAGVIIAELNHRRSRDRDREQKEESLGEADSERLVWDAEGEPERFHLLLTRPELNYLLELIGERRDAVVVARLSGLSAPAEEEDATAAATDGRMRVLLKFKRGQ